MFLNFLMLLKYSKLYHDTVEYLGLWAFEDMAQYTIVTELFL